MTRSATIVAVLAAFLVSGTVNCAAAMRLGCKAPALAAAHTCCGPAFARAASCCCHGQTEHVQALRAAGPGPDDAAARVAGTLQTASTTLGLARDAADARRMRWPDQGLAPPETLLQHHTFLLL